MSAATAEDVLAAVRRHYGVERPQYEAMDTREWAALPELCTGPRDRRRIDLFVIRCWSSAPKLHERHAIEVKVSRSDLRRELAEPYKREGFVAASHRFYLATPAGLVDDPASLPDDVGLLEMGPRGGITVRREIPRTDAEPITEAMYAEVMRRAWKAEARIRAAETGDQPAEIVRLNIAAAAAERREWALKDKVARLERKLTLATMALDGLRSEAPS